MSRLRLDEDGWVEIGKRDSAGRRSMWLRIVITPEETARARDMFTKLGFGVTYDSADNVEAFELCAGREGDDAYVRVDRTNPQFEELLDMMTTARYAATM